MKRSIGRASQFAGGMVIAAALSLMVGACANASPTGPSTASGGSSSSGGSTSSGGTTQGPTTPTSSTRYVTPLSGSCVRQYYDATFYNWLAFQNVCNQSISVVYIANNPGYGGSAMTLSPNQHDSTGWSNSEVNAKGGFQLYICPAGYIPVDGNDNYVSRINTSYRCRQL